MITLDTSAIVALFVAGDRYHRDAVRCLEEVDRITVVPAAILAEVDACLRRLLVTDACISFLEAIERGDPLLDCGDMDPPRIKGLMARHADLGLRFPDAAVVACAERNGGAVLAFDRRDLEVVALDALITLLP